MYRKVIISILLVIAATLILTYFVKPTVFTSLWLNAIESTPAERQSETIENCGSTSLFASDKQQSEELYDGDAALRCFGTNLFVNNCKNSTIVVAAGFGNNVPVLV